MLHQCMNLERQAEQVDEAGGVEMCIRDSRYWSDYFLKKLIYDAMRRVYLSIAWEKWGA